MNYLLYIGRKCLVFFSEVDKNMEDENALSLSLVPSKGRGGSRADKDSDWSDVSSLTEDSEESFKGSKPKIKVMILHTKHSLFSPNNTCICEVITAHL